LLPGGATGVVAAAGAVLDAVAATAAGAAPAPAIAISRLAKMAIVAVVLAARRSLSRAIAMPFP
jgi:hypothetical protein